MCRSELLQCGVRGRQNIARCCFCEHWRYNQQLNIWLACNYTRDHRFANGQRECPRSSTSELCRDLQIQCKSKTNEVNHTRREPGANSYSLVRGRAAVQTASKKNGKKQRQAYQR